MKQKRTVILFAFFTMLFSMSAIAQCTTPPNQLPPVIDAVNGTVTLSWDGDDTGWFYCQVRVTDPLTGNTKRIRRPYPGDVVINYLSNLAPNETYVYNTQCACSFGPPVSATPISSLSSFTTPTFRVGNQVSGATIFPNPTADYLMVDYKAVDTEEVEINVIDLTGRTVMTQAQLVETGQNRIELNLTELVDGQYILQIQSAEGNTIENFIVQH